MVEGNWRRNPSDWETKFYLPIQPPTSLNAPNQPKNTTMTVRMKNWEVERVKEIVSDVLELWSGDFIEVGDGNGNSRSMSKQTFLKTLDEELRK